MRSWCSPRCSRPETCRTGTGAARGATTGSELAFTTYAWLLRATRTSVVSTYAYVNPLVAVFLGWAVENESVSARTLVAGVVILAAVALIVTPPKGQHATEPAPVPVRGR